MRRRAWLSSSLLLLSACAITEAAPGAPATPAPALAPPAPARFELTGSRVDGGALRVAGTVTGALAPATFRLRQGYGCSREATLPTITTGAAFSVAMTADDLAVAFGCAVDVEVDGELSETLAVTPTARAVVATGGLALDPDLALVSAELDPRAGDRVRFTVHAPEPLASARATLAASSYGARLVASDDAPDAIFELPAEAWAAAVVSGTHVVVEARTLEGGSASIVVAPYAVAEAMPGED
jgi:hypothetical protein